MHELPNTEIAKSGTMSLTSDEFNISRIEKPKEGGNGHLKRFETAT